jgi:hypothetical protein
MSDLITNNQFIIFIQFINMFLSFRRQRSQLYHQAAALTLIAHQTLHHQRRSRRKLNQLRKLRSQLYHHHLILIPVHLMPSQLKRDQELPQTFPLPPREALTKHKRKLKKLLFHKRKLRLSHHPLTLIALVMRSQLRKLLQPRKLPRKIQALTPDLIAPVMLSQLRKPPRLKALDLHLDLILALMIKKRPRLRPQLLLLQLRLPPPSVTSTMVNLSSSFKDLPSRPMRIA